jgi:hypothetical protein
MWARNVVESRCLASRGELLVLVGRQWLLVHVWRGVLGERAQSGSVGFTPALLGQAARCLQQPERGAHPMRGGGEPEQTTHCRIVPLQDRTDVATEPPAQLKGTARDPGHGRPQELDRCAGTNPGRGSADRSALSRRAARSAIPSAYPRPPRSYLSFGWQGAQRSKTGGYGSEG